MYGFGLQYSYKLLFASISTTISETDICVKLVKNQPNLVLAENSVERWGGAGLQCPGGRERGEGGARLLASPSFSLPEIIFYFMRQNCPK